ncbi:hypothetical protein L0P88_19480 [Muricauda sp. SCSIO 64092]|uniref:hypothetical protein n=1 Tax=Allomuricauda sp. SCSIO 64092 TaxID=2908842 RepID=UPI001FF36A61|nr:hypothetical protein [Muricauda sp. SCSIO 64092]UOY06095.1 hypothetical protein L0P88_19480 [Muricauda sp. SCSIO 64092]
MSRIANSIKNARVTIFFYAITIFVAFFSRKIFLDVLGADFVGLVALLRNILGFLNLAELGIGWAVGVKLYKPLYDNDKAKINEIIQFTGIAYRRIGLIVLGLAVLASVFFPWFFADQSISLDIVYFAFFAFVLSSLLAYFVNYHQILLQADQKEYVIAKYSQSVSIVKSLTQIALVSYFSDIYLWIGAELLFTVVQAILFRWKTGNVYPWLKLSLKGVSRNVLKKHPELVTKIKQVFVHKLAFFVKESTDQILIYAFVSLKSVAFFSNYYLIFGYLKVLINNIFTGTQASVGNLVAENNKDSINKVYWEMMAIRHFFAGFLFFSLFFLIEPFILIWIGSEYILEREVLILMLANIYISQIRSPTEMFINAYGLFNDTWAPITEAVINLVISIIFGKLYGIAGIMLGTFVSTLIIVLLWKPYFLYRDGFSKSVGSYWIGFFKLFGSFLLAFMISKFLIGKLIHSEISNYWDWFIYALQIVSLSSIIYSVLMFFINQGFRDFTFRVKKIILKKING